MIGQSGEHGYKALKSDEAVYILSAADSDWIAVSLCNIKDRPSCSHLKTASDSLILAVAQAKDSTTQSTNHHNIMDAFKGKFERTSVENYEEFLKVLDVNYLLRKAATISTPVMEFTEDNGVWSIKSSTTLKSMELKFKVSLTECQV